MLDHRETNVLGALCKGVYIDSGEPRGVPRVKRQPVFERWQCKLACVFEDAILFWLLTMWLIKSVLSKLSGVLINLEHL